MALFGRLSPAGDPELRRLLGRRRVLARAVSADGAAYGLVDRLVYRHREDWLTQPWHEIEHGGWDAERQTLRWVDVAGRRGELALTETGQLPDLFNERVTASIACLRSVPLAGEHTVTISARRDLGAPTAPLIWRITPGKGVHPSEVDADPLVQQELEQLRAEYDLH